MKVVLVGNTTPEDRIAGLARYVRELAGALSRAGVATTILVKRDAGAPRVAIGADGVRILGYAVPSKANPLFAAAYPLYTARGVLRAPAALRDQDTVVHAHFAVSALPLAVVRIPYLYTFHAPVWQELLDEQQGTYRLPGALARPAVAGLRISESHVVSRAQATFVLSDYMRGHLRELSVRAEAGAVRIPGGIDLAKFSPGPPEPGPPPSGSPGPDSQGPLLFTARRLTPRTGVDRLIRALPEVLGEHPRARLAIAGAGEMDAQLRALAVGLGVGERVAFLGGIADSELVGWYRRADLVVMPTVKLEGFGLSIAEALACGTPVLGTPVGAIPELLGALDPALISAGSSSAELAAAINRLLAAPARLRELGARGRALVAPALGWDAIAARYLEAYERELAGRR